MKNIKDMLNNKVNTNKENTTAKNLFNKELDFILGVDASRNIKRELAGQSSELINQCDHVITIHKERPKGDIGFIDSLSFHRGAPTTPPCFAEIMYDIDPEYFTGDEKVKSVEKEDKIDPKTGAGTIRIPSSTVLSDVSYAGFAKTNFTTRLSNMYAKKLAFRLKNEFGYILPDELYMKFATECLPMVRDYVNKITSECNVVLYDMEYMFRNTVKLFVDAMLQYVTKSLKEDKYIHLTTLITEMMDTFKPQYEIDTGTFVINVDLDGIINDDGTLIDYHTATEIDNICKQKLFQSAYKTFTDIYAIVMDQYNYRHKWMCHCADDEYNRFMEIIRDINGSLLQYTNSGIIGLNEKEMIFMAINKLDMKKCYNSVFFKRMRKVGKPYTKKELKIVLDSVDIDKVLREDTVTDKTNAFKVSDANLKGMIKHSMHTMLIGQPANSDPFQMYRRVKNIVIDIYDMCNCLNK